MFYKCQLDPFINGAFELFYILVDLLSSSIIMSENQPKSKIYKELLVIYPINLKFYVHEKISVKC